jgi:hypothetical protein
MNVKQIRKLVSKKFQNLIERFKNAKTDLGIWDPGENDGCLIDELVECNLMLSKLIESIEEKSFNFDEDEDDDSEEDDVEELDAKFEFDEDIIEDD